MGILTSRVKRVVRDPDIVYPGTHGRWVATRKDEPGFRVVYQQLDDAPPLVITVVFLSYEPYVRQGESFVPVYKGQPT